MRVAHVTEAGPERGSGWSLGEGLQRIVDGLIAAVRLGLRGFRPGGSRENLPPGLSLALLNRLARILRLAFLIVATHLELEPARARAPASAKRARTPRVVRRPRFPLFPRLRPMAWRDTPGAVPQGFAAPRDLLETCLRKRAAILHALTHANACIRRMARRLPKQLAVFGWFPPKRPPPLDRRDFWDELMEGWREARFKVGEYRRRRRDTQEEGTPARPAVRRC